MTLLKSDFVSGAIFTAGSFTGQVDGVSGLNNITDRVNNHTHDGVDTPTVTNFEVFNSTGSSNITGGDDTIVGSVVMANVQADKPVVISAYGMVWDNTGLSDGAFKTVGSQAVTGIIGNDVVDDYWELTTGSFATGSFAAFPGYKFQISNTVMPPNAGSFTAFLHGEGDGSDNPWIGSFAISLTQAN